MRKYVLTIFGLIFLITLGITGWIVWPIFFAPLTTVLTPEEGLIERGGKEAQAFVNVTKVAGFNHVHHKPYLDPKIDGIMSWMTSIGAAAAAGDFDNDGFVDLYVTDSHKGKANYLYHNKKNGTFVDVAKQAGVAENINNDSGVSMDVVWGDYDNDGYLDLFVVKWGRDVLFHNNGNGTFTNVTAKAFRNENNEPGSPWTNGNAATWVDYDGDGLLDIYVGNYFAPVDLWHLKHTKIMHDNFEKSRNAGKNALFHNNGNGTFTNVAPKLKLDDQGWTLSVGHGDINNDGWPDIYCANDFGTDQLFLNQGDGTFNNISETAFGADTKKGMNVDFGDFDNDGWLDIYVTNITTAEYLKEGNMLWHNAASDENGIPIFMDISVESGSHNGGWGWGAKFFDFDNDADLDIMAVNGFITAGEENYWYDLASWTVKGQDVSDALNWPVIGDRSFSGNEATRLWRNDGHQRFSEIAAQAGVDSYHDGRGVILFDYDNDGDLDVYLANQGMPPAFYRNDIGGSGHWLGLQLIGNPKSGSNRDAIGARVTIMTASGPQIRELEGGNSYSGQSDRRVYFGLGDDMIINTLEIRWPSRQIQVIQNVRADKIITIEEPDELPKMASMIPATRDKIMESHTEMMGASPEMVLSPAERDAILSKLEEKVRNHPDDIVIASKYRIQCIKLGEYDRSVHFFEQLTNELPKIRNIRLQLGLTYIDKMPKCGGMAAIVCKGTLARQSLDQLTILIEADEKWWPAIYARAMNHLHWPRALRHSSMAIEDFKKCLKLLEIQSKDTSKQVRSYHVRAYIGFGDALAKNGEFEKAKAAWKEGMMLFPGNRELKKRIVLKSGEEGLAFVEKVRNLEKQIDTDFSFLLNP
ncbi:CRTAC1 family protein [Candidatus Parabeggiatoa sp. HSG14]|uniref:CRTAC1 family protein n=1 Tax=Candidatus Parabeggiatoa sp. HSG14 TaxID=3055593 RepID=UPI0025A876FA|nr:CRTAC1 family protein [Thiotrichales bacterium HSG14]